MSSVLPVHQIDHLVSGEGVIKLLPHGTGEEVLCPSICPSMCLHQRVSVQEWHVAAASTSELTWAELLDPQGIAMTHHHLTFIG